MPPVHRLLLLGVLALVLAPIAPVAAAPLAHMVFFTLAEEEPGNAEKLVALCHKHLDGHDGVVYFSVGARAKQLDRGVNDKGFDVALHVVFDGPASHDKYQTAPRHLRFIDEGKSLWSAVRVFDSHLAEKPADDQAVPAVSQNEPAVSKNE